MAQGYHPEQDDTNELEQDEITTFQELIVILRWAIEIVKVDILFEVSTLSIYQATPCEVHLEEIYHIFALKKNTNLTLYFEPQDPNIDPSCFNRDYVNAFKDHYQYAEEQFPSSHMCPKSQGVPVSTIVLSMHCMQPIKLLLGVTLVS